MKTDLFYLRVLASCIHVIGLLRMQPRPAITVGIHACDEIASYNGKRVLFKCGIGYEDEPVERMAA